MRAVRLLVESWYIYTKIALSAVAEIMIECGINNNPPLEYKEYFSCSSIGLGYRDLINTHKQTRVCRSSIVKRKQRSHFNGINLCLPRENRIIFDLLIFVDYWKISWHVLLMVAWHFGHELSCDGQYLSHNTVTLCS